MYKLVVGMRGRPKRVSDGKKGSERLAERGVTPRRKLLPALEA